jgi:hypothetical protein
MNRKKTSSGLALIAVLGIAIWYLLFVNPLPRDEEMIAHYSSHKNDLVKLVQKYREYERPLSPSTEFNKLPEIVWLKSQAGVRDLNSSGAIWMSSPYSIETANYLIALAKSDGAAYFKLQRRFGAISIKPADHRFGMRTVIVRGTLAIFVWKDYYFFPEPPRIEGQKLLDPVNTRGIPNREFRVFESLNDYPRNWRKGECVFRAIDRQWFIRMCWGAN